MCRFVFVIYRSSVPVHVPFKSRQRAGMLALEEVCFELCVLFRQTGTRVLLFLFTDGCDVWRGRLDVTRFAKIVLVLMASDRFSVKHDTPRFFFSFFPRSLFFNNTHFYIMEKSGATLASSPTAVHDLSELFPNHHYQHHPKDQNVPSLASLIEALPEALETRKTRNIPPGAPNDPVSGLLRYVYLTYY